MKENRVRKIFIKFSILLTGFFKKVSVLLLTLGIWLWIIHAFLWVVGAFGWSLIVYMWRKNFFVPQAAYFTTLTLLIILFWAIFIWLLMLIWVRYNYYKYYKRNRRTLALPKFNVKDLTWNYLHLDEESLNKIISRECIPIELNGEFLENYTYKEKKENFSSYFIVSKKDFCTSKGEVIVPKNKIVNKEDLEKAIEKGLYWNFIVELSKDLTFEEGSL